MKADAIIIIVASALALGIVLHGMWSQGFGDRKVEEIVEPSNNIVRNVEQINVENQPEGSVARDLEETNIEHQPVSDCIPDGSPDDVGSKTSCCSHRAVEGSTLCENQEDWFNGWESCTNICGTTGVTLPKCPHGPTGTHLCPCPAGTASNGLYGIGVCN